MDNEEKKAAPSATEVNMEGKKKKRPSLRLLIQVLWTALTNGYLFGFFKGKIYTGKTKAICVPGLNCYSCPGALGSCPIGALQATLDARQYHMAFYVLGFLMFFGSLFGRFVCGFLCPFGLVQDLLYKIPFPYKRKNMPGHQVLQYLKVVVLLVLVLLLPSVIVDQTGGGSPWFCEFLCPSGTLFGAVPLVSANPSLQQAVSWRFVMKMTILAILLLGSIMYYRPFCKYLCPLGVLYGLFNPIAFYRFAVDSEKCTKCGACQKACRMDIPVYLQPNSMNCIRCGDCKRACPTGAIHHAHTFGPMTKKKE